MKLHQLIINLKEENKESDKKKGIRKKKNYENNNKNINDKSNKLNEEKNNEFIKDVKKEINPVKCEIINSTLNISGIDKNNLKGQLKDNPKLYTLLKFIFDFKLYKNNKNLNNCYFSTLDSIIFLVSNKSFIEFTEKLYSNDISTKDIRPKSLLTDEEFKFIYSLDNKIYKEDENKRTNNEIHPYLSYIINNNLPFFIMYFHYDNSINELFDKSFNYFKKKSQKDLEAKKEKEELNKIVEDLQSKIEHLEEKIEKLEKIRNNNNS